MLLPSTYRCGRRYFETLSYALRIDFKNTRRFILKVVRSEHERLELLFFGSSAPHIKTLCNVLVTKEMECK
jgi:hypothetical protein